MRAFTERPYDEVSTDDIAARAGISRGLLFHYYPTKHDYYVAVLRVAGSEISSMPIIRPLPRTSPITG